MSRNTENLFAILGQPRAAQEGFLAARGWVRLVERADVWIHTRTPGEEAHSVYTFRFALERAVILEYFRRKTAKERAGSIHHNEAAAAMKEQA